jgi:peptidoglycan-N-acetylglucosamine deacetylase
MSNSHFAVTSPLRFVLAHLAFGALVFLPLGQKVYAAGPAEVATLSRSLWPVAFQSPEEFDMASRIALLTCGRALAMTDTTPLATLKQRFAIKSFDSVSYSKWRLATWERLRQNFNLASKSKPRVENQLAYFGDSLDAKSFQRATGTFEEKLSPAWIPTVAAMQKFSTIYLQELGRLAALFPKVTSEISVFDSAEIQGFTDTDKHFLLTFDDGPTPKGGHTDSLMAVLRARKLNGVFFVLGERFTPRARRHGSQEIKSLFADMPVEVHGQTHVSHARLPAWKEQVLGVNHFIDSVMTRDTARPFLWRPPYGQRVETASQQLAAHKARIMLWNIDSQDWNNKVSGEDAANRCLTLMLLWRRGILLFHDIHPKAQVAVPLLHAWLKNAGVTWLDAKGVAP